MNSYKLAKIVSFVLAIAATIFFFVTELVTIDKTTDNHGIVTGFIVLSYIAFAIALIAVIYYVIKETMQDKQGLRKTLISLGLLVGAFIIGLLFADGAEVIKNDVVIVSAGASRMIGAFLNMFYIIALAALAVLVWANFSKLKK